MTLKSELGARGENYACEYLQKKGYTILARNVREKFGELDIVTHAQDKTLVFVEVKTMRAGILTPEDQMTYAKRMKFMRIASLYANAHEEYIHNNRGFRLDVLALTYTGNDVVVTHYENVG